MALRVLVSIAISLPCACGVGAGSDAASDEVALLQVALGEASTARRARNVGVSSFVNNVNGYCAEGPQNLAAAALATFKVAPFRALFNESLVRPGENCASRGFTFAGGDDNCYHGLQTFYTARGAKDTMGLQVLATMMSYAGVHGQNDTTWLVSHCICNPQSQLGQTAERTASDAARCADLGAVAQQE